MFIFKKKKILLYVFHFVEKVKDMFFVLITCKILFVITFDTAHNELGLLGDGSTVISDDVGFKYLVVCQEEIRTFR